MDPRGAYPSENRPIGELVALCATAAAVSFLALPLQAPSYDDLAGGWVVQSWTLADGTEVGSPQPGLILFTATGQYSMTYVRGTEPRSNLPDDATDAQLGVASSARARPPAPAPSPP